MIEKNGKSIGKFILAADIIPAALWTGISLLVMAVAAGIAYGAIHGQLVVPGDSGATGANISAHRGLWTLEIILWLLIAAADIVVSIGLYRIFIKSGRSLSFSAMIARLAYTAGLLAAVGFLFRAYDPARALDAAVRFEQVWYISLVVFGLHLTLLGILAFRSSFVHWIFSLLLVIAGPAYTVIHLLFAIGGTAADTGAALQTVLGVPMTLAELGLAVWFIVCAVRSRRSLTSS